MDTNDSPIANDHRASVETVAVGRELRGPGPDRKARDEHHGSIGNPARRAPLSSPDAPGLRSPSFGPRSTADEVLHGLDLTGHTVLLTGANSGIGFESVRALAARGARAVAVARTERKATEALRRAGANGVPVAMDLAEPASVTRGAERVRYEVDRLDSIVANAGIMGLPEATARYGYELHFLTNHLGHHLLVRELLDLLADEGRVVVVSSRAHRRAPPAGIEFDNLSGARDYSPLKAYGQSKLANLLFAKALARRLPHPGQTSNALHPGVIETELWRHMNPWLMKAVATAGRIVGRMKSVEQGAATQCFLAAHPAVAGKNGLYFADCAAVRTSRRGADEDLADRLWEESERILRELG